MPLDKPVAVIQVQGIRGKAIRQGRPNRRDPRPTRQERGLCPAILDGSQVCHHDRHGRLGAGNQSAYGIQQAAAGLVLNLAGQIAPGGLEDELHDSI
jgi:hypothetical protein